MIKSVECEYESDMQFQCLGALVQCFEKESVNVDKFLIWMIKKYGRGQSLFLHQINKGNEDD